MKEPLRVYSVPAEPTVVLLRLDWGDACNVKLEPTLRMSIQVPMTAKQIGFVLNAPMDNGPQLA